MSARDNILARIRKAHGRAGDVPTPSELAAIGSEIARHAVGPQPAFAHAPDPRAQFVHECDRLGTTYQDAPTLADMPRAVRRYLDANALAPRVVIWHEFAALDWAGAGIEVDDRPAQPDDRTGVTGCFCAIAETGSLLLLSSAATPKSTALLPETHIAFVPMRRLVANLEDAFALARNERGEPPRSMWLISGPSRTADIEQTIVIGAHGPYRVHAIVVP